jgi:serine/threonine-protein kinase
VEDRTVFQPFHDDTVRPGVRLNGIYEIESLIGKGGMGEVYRGVSIQTRDPYAIKMIRPDLSNDPEILALFSREATTLYRLQHEAIVRYFVFSIDPGLQRAYLAMEFVDGVALSKRLSSGPLSLAEVEILKARVAGGLDAAHRLGVVHRDISSDNLILPGGDVRQAKIIDFGIARSSRVGEATIIGTGFAGKHKYASPEQESGAEVTFKSDIYSFGLVLAEALRGRPIDMGGSIVEIVEKRRVVPDLSDIDPKFRPLLQAMLQPDPANRPESMAAVAAWTSGTPSKRTPPEARAPGRPPRAASSGRMPALLGMLIACVGVAATLYVFRDNLGEAIKSLAPGYVGVRQKTPTPVASSPSATPESSSAASISPTPSPSGSQTPVVSTSPNPTPGGSNSSSETAPNAGDKQLNVADIRDLLKPRAPRTDLDLPPAVVGEAYSSDIPGFVDPMNKGLRIEAEASPPEGLALDDLGMGHSVLKGVPKAAGSAVFGIVARNPKGQSARMEARIEVSPAPPAAAPTTPPPTPSTAPLKLPDAMVAKAFSADFSASAAGKNAAGLTLRAEPDPPAGLRLLDLGSGSGRIAGRPTEAGSFAFDVIAKDGAGAESRKKFLLTVAPAREAAIVEPPPASLADRQLAFLARYDGGSCTLFRREAGGNSGAVDGYGADAAAFAKFGAAHKLELGVEPDLHSQAIDRPECPTLDLLRLAAMSGFAPPRVEMDSMSVGGGKALAGKVSGLEGRRLVLLLIDNDGFAHVIPHDSAADGRSAQFSDPIKFDEEDIGHTLAVLAIVSDKPFAALSAPRLGRANALLPKLFGEWAGSAAAADVQFVTVSR